MILRLGGWDGKGRGVSGVGRAKGNMRQGDGSEPYKQEVLTVGGGRGSFNTLGGGRAHTILWR